jgi:hypothetical protein
VGGRSTGKTCPACGVIAAKMPLSARYPAAGQPGPVRYGPRDAVTLLAGAGRRVAMRDGERVTPAALARLAAEL